MQVRVRYFAFLRERQGRDEDTIDLAAGATAADAYHFLALPAELPVAFVVNLERVQPSQVLHEGDELAFLPPVGGG